jgi:hypothetical protein
MIFVILDGTTVNATPLQLVVFCGAIDGIGHHAKGVEQNRNVKAGEMEDFRHRRIGEQAL